MNEMIHCLHGVKVAVAAISIACLVGGCAVEPTVAAPPPPTFAESMSSAEALVKAGSMSNTIAAFERAAAVEPTNKQPWLRMAQVRFDAHEYGQAITAADQVLQRDASDVTAKSILTAAGLRASANGLQQLRAADAVTGNTRDEAQSLAKIMRDALGEPILPAAAAGQPDKPRPITRKQAVKPVTRDGAAPPLPAAKLPDGAKPANPFNALKG